MKKGWNDLKKKRPAKCDFLLFDVDGHLELFWYRGDTRRFTLYTQDSDEYLSMTFNALKEKEITWKEI